MVVIALGESAATANGVEQYVVVVASLVKATLDFCAECICLQ